MQGGRAHFCFLMRACVCLIVSFDLRSVEWWDQPLLDGSSYEAPQKEDAITNYIHVPVLLDPVAELPPPPPMQMMLTQKEKKKIKRIQKKEKQREEADKIRLGLIEPPGTSCINQHTLHEPLLPRVCVYPSGRGGFLFAKTSLDNTLYYLCAMQSPRCD